MARCYTPPDHIALLDAVRLIAETRHPERWVPASMSLVEAGIWNGLDTKWNPDFVEDHLRVHVQENRNLMIKRIISFDNARTTIRDALCSEEISSCVFNDLGRRLIIGNEIWRNTAGEIIIRKGSGWFDEGDPHFFFCRCVFLKKSEIAPLLRSDAPDPPKAAITDTSAPSSTASLCRVVADLLRSNPAATKAQAQAVIREAGLAVTDNRFRTTIWRQARTDAGLSEKASAGKKRSAPRG